MTRFKPHILPRHIRQKEWDIALQEAVSKYKVFGFKSECFVITKNGDIYTNPNYSTEDNEDGSGGGV